MNPTQRSLSISSTLAASWDSSGSDVAALVVHRTEDGPGVDSIGDLAHSCRFTTKQTHLGNMLAAQPRMLIPRKLVPLRF